MYEMGQRVVHPIHGHGTIFDTVCVFDGFIYVKFDNSADVHTVMIERLTSEEP